MLENGLHIFEFRDDLANHFKDLNIAWLQKYFYVEPVDEEMLSNPKHYIIDKGGYIFFAKMNNEIAGTFALMKVKGDVYELAKMAVDEKFQGHKIGNTMMEFAIEKVKSLAATKLILYSNTMLGPAIHLYKKYGFVEVPLENSEYERANIKMQKDLTPGPSPTKLERGEVSSVEEPYPKYRVSNTVQYKNAKKNRPENTEVEEKLWEQLRDSKLGYQFSRQHPVENFIADFVCLQKRVIVEVDGGYHDNKGQQKYDKHGARLLEQKGFTILRFTNDEIMENVYTVRNKIKQMLNTQNEFKSVADSSPLSISAGEGPGVRNKSRIKELFERKKQNILNVYCTAGYPQLKCTRQVMKSLQDNGADLIELGIPYSDPLADGPVIQASGSKAIQNGMTVAKLFEQLKGFRQNSSSGDGGITIPVVLMGYTNQVLQYGFEKFCADAEKLGIDGLIFPDLPMYEYENEYRDIIKKHNLDFIFLVTPETSEERIRKLDSLSSGFLYAVSSSSTTGKEKDFSVSEKYLQKLQAMNLTNPVLVGFGIKDKQTFETACKYTNGAIIGTAYIKALENESDVKEATKQFLDKILK